jgi:hypothetical protein
MRNPGIFAVCAALLGTLGLPSTEAIASGSDTQILWLPLSRPWTLELLERDLQNGELATNTITAPSSPNPFALEPVDFRTGEHLAFPVPRVGEAEGSVPAVSDEDARWFTQLIRQGEAPDVFIVAGHHVLSEGFHNDAETAHLYLPTLFDTIAKHADAAKAFERVKLAILWGCNTLTNLEPHAANGAYLSPERIRSKFESGPAGRRRAMGASRENNTLEFYKSRLARAYGPEGHKYEYTRDEAAERCDGPGRFEHCRITNLERIMPDRGLYDGSHRFNNPYQMKRLFPNARLVLGFSSASPAEETRVKLLSRALQATYHDFPGLKSVFGAIVADGTPETLRMRVIESLRRHWALVTYAASGKPAGSITPAYPELDADGVFNVDVHSGDKWIGPTYSPYEER